MNCVLIEIESILLKKRNNKGVMFDGIEADGGAEGSMNGAEVGGENWGRKVLEKLRFVGKGRASSEGRKCGVVKG